jgi:hypothetical protein
MAKLWCAPQTPSSFAATDAQAGYPASNIGLQSLGRPWYAIDAGGKEVTINFPAPSLVQVLHLHDVNFATANVQKSVSGGAFVNVGALNPAANEDGRYRGYLTINEALCTALKIQIAAGNPTDGLLFWRVGSGYLFRTVLTLPFALEYGYELDTQYSQIGTVLVNKRKAVARIGGGSADHDEIKLPYNAKNSESLADIVRRTRLGTCLFTTDLPNYPEELWPVIRQEDNSTKSRYAVNLAKRSITLTEVV